MKSIDYKLEFFSEWHCGSGLSKGADVDALVVKDSRGLPFVPGRTIKGLLREQVELLIDLRKLDLASQLDAIFGIKKVQEGALFCSNAELSKTEQNEIYSRNLTKYLYRSLSFTAINDDGVAENHSLRKIEAVVPCILEGTIEIEEVTDEMLEIITSGLKLIKRLGTHRSRGLGRCRFTIK